MSSNIDPLLQAQAVEFLMQMPEEQRVQRAADAFNEGKYTKISVAARAWNIKYHKLRSRINGAHSRKENGGNNTKLTDEEDLSLQAWINLHASVGK